MMHPMKTLILVAEPHGCTQAIARAMALRLRAAGHRVDVNDVVSATNSPPDGYDAVIVGAEPSRKRDRRIIGNYISRHRPWLQGIPTGLFILSSTRPNPREDVEAFETRVGWRAQFAAVFSYGRTTRVL